MTIEIRRPSAEELEIAGVRAWPVWEKEPSKFSWHYDEKESCYIIEGRAKITGGDRIVEFKAGDFVVFPQGLSCEWEIIEKIKKHYKFG